MTLAATVRRRYSPAMPLARASRSSPRLPPWTMLALALLGGCAGPRPAEPEGAGESIEARAERCNRWLEQVRLFCRERPGETRWAGKFECLDARIKLDRHCLRPQAGTRVRRP